MEHSPATRSLWHVPIVHTSADMGALEASLQNMKVSKLGRQGLKRGVRLVDQIWEEIERAVRALPIPPGLRVYQDGLPVCGRESQIVSDLAQAGSRNHKLLMWLQERGAELMGTESAELLVEEYNLAKAAVLTKPSLNPRPDPAGAALLEKRDRFIASRINATLGSGETGILFLGMLHAVKSYLERDIRITCPVRKL